MAPRRHRRRKTRKYITIAIPLPRARRAWLPPTLAAVAVGAIAVAQAFPAAPQPAISSTAIHLYSWPHGMPAGITLSGLQGFEVTQRTVAVMKNQIRAARYYWHANTVRLQILQDRLVGARGNRYAAYYMRDIRALTDYGLHLGLTVVLNAQTELSTGYAQDEPLPTIATQAFWQRVMVYYKNTPGVVFDLFNEPRRCNWGQWRTAFQGLVDYIRGQGARNQIWVEGLWWAATLESMPLLHGTGIVYSFHHPGGPWPWDSPVTTVTWDNAFGYLAARGVPVVDGEFGNYVGSYYWGTPSLPAGQAAPRVTAYLRYLTAHHIGMLAWSLVPGSLNSTGSFTSVSHEPQGDGALVRDWFGATTHAVGAAEGQGKLHRHHRHGRPG